MPTYVVNKFGAKMATDIALEYGSWISIEPWPDGVFWVKVKDENTHVRRHLEAMAVKAQVEVCV
jgi:hypothetical protein